MLKPVKNGVPAGKDALGFVLGDYFWVGEGFIPGELGNGGGGYYLNCITSSL